MKRCRCVRQAKTTCSVKTSASRRRSASRVVTSEPSRTVTCTRFIATTYLTCCRCTPSSPNSSSVTSSLPTTCAMYVRKHSFHNDQQQHYNNNSNNSNKLWWESTTNPSPCCASQHRAVSPNWPKIESRRPMVTPHLPWKFHVSSRFLVIVLTKKQRYKERKKERKKSIENNTSSPDVSGASSSTWLFDTPGAIFYRCSINCNQVSISSYFRDNKPHIGVTTLTLTSQWNMTSFGTWPLDSPCAISCWCCIVTEPFSRYSAPAHVHINTEDRVSRH